MSQVMIKFSLETKPMTLQKINHKLLIYFSTFLFSVAYAQDTKFIFTNPTCSQFDTKPKNAFCTRADQTANQSQPNGVLQTVLSALKQTGVKKITLASMTFSQRDVAQALCNAAKNGISVDILMDAGSETVVAEIAVSCGANLFKIGTNELEDARGDLHHNKFLLIEKETSSDLIFSTANFSNPGLSINHETWGFVSSANTSSIVQEHICLINTLKQYKSDLNLFRTQLNQCKSKIQNTNNNSNLIESLFIPNDSKKLVDEILKQIRSSKTVLITSNRFSYPPIINALKKSKALDLRLLFDDDLYWAGLQPPNSEKYKTERLDANRINELIQSNIKVNYIQTSDVAKQKMHNKFMIFDNLVIVGAGNYTQGGMLANFENFYFIKDPDLIRNFKNQFEYLWSISNEHKKMPEVEKDI